jgi:hypothetical protein
MDNNVDNDLPPEEPIDPKYAEREEREDAVLIADDTGLLKQQREIAEEEIELGEEGIDKPLP